MRHLTSEQLVDLAEGVVPEPSVPHLQSCEACRTTLAELRITLSDAGAVDVPEPSPLFWDHFSARVRDAVEAEADTGSALGRWLSWRTVPLWVGSLAVVVLAIGIMARGRVPETTRATLSMAVVAESHPDAAIAADDASLSLVADLVTGLDWDTEVEAGLATDLGIDDDVVAGLSDGERRELHQLLRMELVRPPA